MDWGYAVPFCVHWWAVVPITCRTHRGVLMPEGSVVLYRELYGVQTNAQGMAMPNIGLRLDAFEVGRRIQEASAWDPPREYAVIDPSAFARTDGPSVAENLMSGEEEYAKEKSLPDPGGWVEADNTRTPTGGHIGGWDECRRRMNGVTLRGIPRPMVFVFQNARHLLRTIPNMIQHPENVEDMLKKGVEDHAVDCFRYGLMSRPPTPRGEYSESDVIDTRFGTWNEISELAGTPSLSDPNRGSPGGRCLLYTSPSPRDRQKSRMPSSA